MRLLMMFPQELPATLAAVRAARSGHVVELAGMLERGGTSTEAMLAHLQRLPLRPEGVKLDRWEWHEVTRRTEQFAVLDRYFGISRTAADAREMFGHCAAVAYRALLDDTTLFGTDLTPEHWNELRWGLEQAIRFGVGAEPAAAPPTSPVPGGMWHRDAHRRWRTGHQLFFPLVQAILVGLRCFASAVLAGDRPAARESMRFATDVMLASARALQFAADFPPDTYGSAVRPSMTPPGVPQALSGLMSADHHRMVGCFHEIRPVVAGLDDELRGLFDTFVDTVESTYDAHQLVCTRFNGDKVVSLRMNHASAMSAAEVLDQMGKARIKMLRSS